MEILKILFVCSVSFALSTAEPDKFYAALNQGNNLAPAHHGQKHITGNQVPSNPSEARTGEDVTTLDRFYRVYEDGTTEFKFVLSNGVAQYQRITNKEVNGKIIQVYEGYHSEPLPDKSYRTTYYIADENGFRRTRREFDSKPPVLPPYVPYVPKL